MKHFYSLAFLLLFGCVGLKEDREAFSFEDEAQQRGIEFVYQSGMTDQFRLPEIMGGGVALIDSDQDGDLDLYFLQGGEIGERNEKHSNVLYLNDGHGYFDAANAGAASSNLGYGMGVSVGDVNNDQRPDIFISQLGKNVLLLNEGENHFRDATIESGFFEDEWSTASAFADFDKDGDLDLWVVNYIGWRESIEIECYQTMLGSRDYCSPVMYNRPAQDRLYLNDGRGRFQDATDPAGIKGTTGNGLGSVVTDFNGDGLLDVFVANDTTPNHLWLNQGNATFSEQAGEWGAAVDLHGAARAGMGVSAIDLDDDQDQDLIVVNITTEPDYVFRNDGTYFTDIASTIGLGISSQRYTRFGLVISDFNNDGWLDIFEANGAVSRLSSPTGDDLFAEPNAFYTGSEASRYGVPEYTTEIQTSRASVGGDLTGDGYIDLVVVNRDSAPNLYMNQRGDGNWLILDLRDETGNSALGSKVSLTMGNRVITRALVTSGSYLSSGDPRIHIGLGEFKKVNNVVVDWLNGGTSEIEEITANQIYRINQQ